MGEMVRFLADGGETDGYMSLPARGSGPGVLVIQEWWGLVPHIRDVCDRFAEEGFVALAPDLYHGETASEPDEAGKLMMALNLERATKELGGAVDHLLAVDAVTSEKVGVVGFCMGGGLALAVACLRPDAIGACVSFYGVIPWESISPDYDRLEAPVLGHFAEKDAFFPPEKARSLEETLRAKGKRAEIIVYPGVDHAFFNDTRPEVYDREVAVSAWERTVTFLRDSLS